MGVSLRDEEKMKKKKEYLRESSGDSNTNKIEQEEIEGVHKTEVKAADPNFDTNFT